MNVNKNFCASICYSHINYQIDAVLNFCSFTSNPRVEKEFKTDAEILNKKELAPKKLSELCKIVVLNSLKNKTIKIMTRLPEQVEDILLTSSSFQDWLEKKHYFSAKSIERFSGCLLKQIQSEKLKHQSGEKNEEKLLSVIFDEMWQNLSSFNQTMLIEYYKTYLLTRKYSSLFFKEKFFYFKKKLCHLVNIFFQKTMPDTAFILITGSGVAINCCLLHSANHSEYKGCRVVLALALIPVYLTIARYVLEEAIAFSDYIQKKTKIAEDKINEKISIHWRLNIKKDWLKLTAMQNLEVNK